MRRTHLYVALFLTPWITMYAASTLVMHHRVFFTGHDDRVPPDFRVVREMPYELPLEAGASPDQIGAVILSDLGLQGDYSARTSNEGDTVTINRERAFGSYRFTYEVASKELTVEKQQFGLAFFLEMLHRRSGFDKSYVPNDLWALSADAVVGAIVIWAITGIWMWVGMPRTRKLGTLCLAGGSLLFAIFLLIL